MTSPGIVLSGNRTGAVLPVAADHHRVAVRGEIRHDRALGQCDGQRETEVVVGVFADEIDPARRRKPHLGCENRHRHNSRSTDATSSGVTSLMNASIADSEEARYFSLVALRRVDITSTWKRPSRCAALSTY